MDIAAIISNILPWVLFCCLLYFTLILFNFVFAIIQAKRKDATLVLCISKKGKLLAALEIIIYVVALVICIILFINNYRLNSNLTVAITTFNPLTVYTLLFAMHIQDIIFVGKKNILIGNKMYEYRRMKKVVFPKKNQLKFVYGQQEVKVSLMFTNITELKKRLTKTK